VAEDTSSRPAADERGTDIRTFLFADLRGYTRFTQDHGDAAASALAGRFAEVVRDVVPAFEGELLELRGDEALCVFRSARQALRAAVELQRRFRTPTGDGDVFPLGVGMGLDAGEAIPTHGGYRGASLNVAARLCAIAKPGQVLATESAAHLARRVDGLRFVARAPVRVKGMAEAVRLVEVVPEAPLPPVPRSESKRPPISRRVIVAIAAVVVVVSGVVAGVVGGRGGSGQPLTVRHDALVLITPSGQARTVGAVGAAPSGVAVGGGWAWVANRDDGTVTGLRLDGGRSETIPVGTAPMGIAYDHGTLWVADSGSGTVDRINTAGRIAKPIAIEAGNGPQGVAVTAGKVWVSNSLDATVSEIDPGNPRRSRRIPAGPDPTAIVAAHGTIWVANATSDTVTRIDAGTGQVLQPVRVGDGPDALAVSGNDVWVANGESASVTRISATNGQPGETIPAGLSPSAIAATADTVWVSDSRGKLVGLHPSALDRRTRAALNGVPLALAGTSTRQLATVEPPITGHRGGTLRVLAESSPPDPLDPAINFTNPGWQVLFLTNDGLTGFRRVSGPQGETIVPDLATSIPQPTDFGRTYTFEVRRGVRYSNGLRVEPADFRWALERTFDAHVGDYLYSDIRGASACEPRPPPAGCDLRDGIAVNDSAGTVTFHLTRADPDFPYKLALPFADGVPQSVPAPPYCPTDECYQHQPPPVPATGQYRIVPGKLGLNTSGELQLARNPYFHMWSVDARPSGYPNRILFRYGQKPQRETAEVEHGTADVTEPPTATLRQLLAVAPNQIHQHTILGVVYLILNTREAPFTSMLARQAVNYAIDRSALTRISDGETVTTTCQILPPGLLGYTPYCPYTLHTAATKPGTWLAPNREKARQLVQTSRTAADGVTVWLHATGINAPAASRRAVTEFGDKIRSALRSIGYRPHLHLLGANELPPATAQITVNYWFGDYPSPSDYLQLVSCNATGIASSGGYCNDGIDREMSEAERIQASDPTAAAARWARIDHEVTDAAPWVPLYNGLWNYLTSKRVGNYQFNPELQILLDQLWVR